MMDASYSYRKGYCGVIGGYSGELTEGQGSITHQQLCTHSRSAGFKSQLHSSPVPTMLIPLTNLYTSHLTCCMGTNTDNAYFRGRRGEQTSCVKSNVLEATDWL